MARPITLCGSISSLAGPLGRSLHEAGYRELGLPFTYVPFEVRDLAGAITGMRSLGIRGLGVSYPFKERVVPLLDALDPTARRIGAVNTIVNEDGRLIGHNTDWMGAVAALEEIRPLKDARVLLLGAGGAARAIAFGLHERGARVTIANRNTDRAATLAGETGAASAPWTESRAAANYEVVINATTLGQADVDPASPLAEGAIVAGQVVMDIVYKPIWTRLMRQARTSHATIVHGGRMLLHQAAAQFALYTGRAAPLAAMDAALGQMIGN
jgi:shikimate dehydrogenase